MVADMEQYLAFDLSTQSLKAIILDGNFKIIHEDSLNFDVDLPEFATENGVHRHDDKKTITSPTLMWVKALDMILMKMLTEGVDFSKIKMLSGTAQQHGSVYWRKSAKITLGHLNEDSTLADQLQTCFAVSNSPVWMDSSTTEQCENLQNVIGGSVELARITGSKAYERFTGNQIAKVFETEKDSYLNSERISLVSSFLATLFLGDYAPIDFSDGSGMNLLDIQTKQWHPTLLSACAPGLALRLDAPVPASSIIGKVSPYMVARYGFSLQCLIAAFTGDNPASFAGMRSSNEDVVISLGTSDTLLFWTDKASAFPDGHVFVNPLDKEMFMTMLCFKNGSLSRENLCKQFCNDSWEEFDKCLQCTPAGNNGNLALYFDEMEIIPPAQGVYKWNDNDVIVTSYGNMAEEVRALVEGQFIAKRYHAGKFNFQPGPNSSILATGGASTNKSLLQVLSDVFNLPVYACEETSNSACLGCIYRCKQALIGDGKNSYMEVVKDLPPHKLVCKPNQQYKEIYDRMLGRYEKFEQYIISQISSSSLS